MRTFSFDGHNIRERRLCAHHEAPRPAVPPDGETTREARESARGRPVPPYLADAHARFGGLVSGIGRFAGVDIPPGVTGLIPGLGSVVPGRLPGLTADTPGVTPEMREGYEAYRRGDRGANAVHMTTMMTLAVCAVAVAAISRGRGPRSDREVEADERQAERDNRKELMARELATGTVTFDALYARKKQERDTLREEERARTPNGTAHEITRGRLAELDQDIKALEELAADRERQARELMQQMPEVLEHLRRIDRMRRMRSPAYEAAWRADREATGRRSMPPGNLEDMQEEIDRVLPGVPLSEAGLMANALQGVRFKTDPQLNIFMEGAGAISFPRRMEFEMEGGLARLAPTVTYETSGQLKLASPALTAALSDRYPGPWTLNPVSGRTGVYALDSSSLRVRRGS
jgi:hypothetical protein